jgi:hypothetical protein
MLFHSRNISTAMLWALAYSQTDSIITAAYFLISARLRREVWDMIRKIISFFGAPYVVIFIHKCMYFGELYNVCN